MAPADGMHLLLVGAVVPTHAFWLLLGIGPTVIINYDYDFQSLSFEGSMASHPSQTLRKRQRSEGSCFVMYQLVEIMLLM